MKLAIRTFAAAAVACALLAGTAAADGDPASDGLYAQNYFVPYPTPSASSVSSLKRAVVAAYARNYRVKVAIIASTSDLGSVPQLFNKPQQYAKFLGSELRSVYIGPLLIVMPAGFGIYDGGRSTAAEQRVLSGYRIHSSDSSELTRTAATVIQKLTSTGALRSRDILAPVLYAVQSTGHRGAPTQLKFAVGDDSGKSRETVRVYAPKRASPLAVLTTPMRTSDPLKLSSVTWQAPANPPSRKLHFCVSAVDPTGNKSRSCSSLTLT